MAASNSDEITAYVDAVIVPSKPARNTLAKMAVWGSAKLTFPPNKDTRYIPTSIKTNPFGTFQTRGFDVR